VKCSDTTNIPCPKTSNIHDAECGDKSTNDFWNSADAGNKITLQVKILSAISRK
jgi:hypothetical protein